MNGAMPTVAKRVRVELELFEDQVEEFNLLFQELVTGPRVRVAQLEAERAAVRCRALDALRVLQDAVRQHPGTGQARTLVQFLAGLWNGPEYRFDFSDLRTVDTALANACLHYLNYDRLGITDLERHLPDGGRELQGWIERYGIERWR